MSVPTVTALRLTGAANRAQLPLLVLGPALGTSAAALWTECAAGLDDVFDVVAWDLPGHGHNHTVPDESFTMAELAQGVLRVLEEILEQREEFGGSFVYAGPSVGGCVGLQLLLDHPGRVSAAVLIGTGARIGEPAMWAGRIGQVSVSGTPVMVPGSAERWFGPGFLQRHPERGSALLRALQESDDLGYMQVCEALAAFDLRERLGKIAAPVLAVAGSMDLATPTRDLREIADGVQQGRLVELDGVAHLAPAQAPTEVARLIRQHVLGGSADPAGPSYDAGAGVLDPRSRSLITLSALIARGHHEEFSAHVRDARDNGLTDEEIRELIVLAGGSSGPDLGAR